MCICKRKISPVRDEMKEKKERPASLPYLPNPSESKRPFSDVLFMGGIDCDFGKKAFCPLNEESRVQGSANPRMDFKSKLVQSLYWYSVHQAGSTERSV